MLKIDLEKDYPIIFSKLDENEKDLNELRYFVVIDENYEDIDEEEIDIFDPSDYNYLVYITQRVSAMLKEEGLQELASKLEKSDFIENFITSEDDLFGVKSNLSEDELGIEILKYIENILKDDK